MSGLIIGAVLGIAALALILADPRRHR